jgi:aminocarboxymuconate-semialdehyde decarboxylase
MIIDVHSHLVPPDLLAAIRKGHGRFPSLRLVEDGSSLAIAFAGGKPSRPITKGLSDVAGRLAWMDKQGIDRHVVGGWPDWFGYELPAAEGEAWCRLFNDAQLASDATTKSRREPPSRRQGWRCSTPIASCMIHGCCDSSWNCSAPTA